MNLDTLLQRADIWRGGEHSRHDKGQCTGSCSVPTGNDMLDAQLPEGGWPSGALTELLFEAPGIGELQLFMPALARLSRTGRWLAWVAPPYLPYAPALVAAGVDLSRLLLIRPPERRDELWAVEQTLRSGMCGAVLAWPREIDDRALRRLQLAAETGKAMGVLFRSLDDSGRSSPAALRLQIVPSAAGTLLHILKRRGGWSTRPIALSRDHAVA